MTVRAKVLDLIGRKILDFEARRDPQGRLIVYKLPADDGGGTYEVAGINQRYHPEEAEKLADLIGAGAFDEAELVARKYIIEFTDIVATWTSVIGVEAFLRDTAFNRGPRGSMRILQRSLGITDDGRFGPTTSKALKCAETKPISVLTNLRKAREEYERTVVGRDENSRFWKGLVSRWDKALKFAKQIQGETVMANEIVSEANNLNENPLSNSAFDSTVAAIRIAEANVKNETVASDSAFTDMWATMPPIEQKATLKALRLGSDGPIVKAWQVFLLGQSYDPGGLDGDFGDKTVAATSAFQKREGLVPDGVAGRQTLIKAMELGFEFIDEPASDTSGSNYPPRPNFQPVQNTAQRQALFGTFSFIPDPVQGNKEQIRILGNWEAENIVKVPIPQLKKALGEGAPSGIRFNKRVAQQLADLWQAWDDAGLLSRIISYSGGFNARFIRGSSQSLSNHSFGTAFDINAPENWLGQRPALVGKKGSIRELVPLAHKFGFYWGGHFSTRPDGMHFEVAQILKS